MVGVRAVGRLLKTSIKFGIPLGALYYTIDAGVWGNAIESRDAVARAGEKLPPQVIEYSEKLRQISHPDFLPPSDYNYAEKWNHMVLTLFPKLINLPSTVGEYGTKWSLAAYDAIVNATNPENKTSTPPDPGTVLKEEAKKH